MFGPQLVRREVDEPLAAAGVGPARRKGGGQAAESNRMGTEVEAPMGTSICEVLGPRGSSDCRAARASLFQEARGASEGAVGNRANLTSGPESKPKSVSDSDPKSVSDSGPGGARKPPVELVF